MKEIPIYISGVVGKLVERFGTRDPYELCDAMHIRIRRMDLKRKLKGFYFYQSRQQTIVVDCGLNPVMERILTAHELGHAVLHREAAMMRGFQEMEILERENAMPRENEANFFAAELLIPDADAVQHLQEESFFDAARSLFVPAALLDYKFSLLQARGMIEAVLPPDVRTADFLRKTPGAYEE